MFSVLIINVYFLLEEGIWNVSLLIKTSPDQTMFASSSLLAVDGCNDFILLSPRDVFFSDVLFIFLLVNMYIIHA